MNYETLTAADLQEIARLRVRELETAHVRAALIWAEASDTTERDAAEREMTELSRRIAVHVVRPEQAADDVADDGEADAGERDSSPDTVTAARTPSLT